MSARRSRSGSCAPRLDEIESWPERAARPARLRRRRRGLARGCDRDRRLAAGRALRPAGGTDRRHGLGGDWKGSGRAGGSFDLHGGLSACAEHLERFGGHRAAAGLSIQPEKRRGLRRGVRRATPTRCSTDEDLGQRIPSTRSSAAPSSGCRLCEELARLAPFGLGNPGITLLVDGCELASLDTVGEGKHLRFRVRQRGRDAGEAIAFGLGAQIDRYRRVGRYDVAFRLQENRWNGTVSPQLVVRRIFDERRALRGAPRRGSPSSGAAANRHGRPRRAAMFAELELAGGARRSLLESESSGALLEAPPLAQAA